MSSGMCWWSNFMMNYSLTGEPLDALDELLLELQGVSGSDAVPRLVCFRSRRLLKKLSMGPPCAPC